MLQKQQHKYNIEAMRTEKERRSNFEAIQVARNQAAYHGYRQAYYYPEESIWGSAGSFNNSSSSRKKQPRLACKSNTQDQ